MWMESISSRGMPGAVGLGPPPQEPVFRWEPWRSGADAVEESALVAAAGGGSSLGVVGMDAWGHADPQASSLSAEEMRALSSILRGFQDGRVQGNFHEVSR